MSRWILTHDRLIFSLVYRKAGWKGWRDGYGHIYIFLFWYGLDGLASEEFLGCLYTRVYLILLLAEGFLFQDW